MPIFTVKHCLICYKEDGAKPNPPKTETDPKSKSNPSDDDNIPPDANMTFASNIKALNKNSEICRRFCTLASRYLNMDAELFKPHATLNSKWAVNIDRACSSCAERLSSFCDIYFNWQYLKLQLDQRVGEILEVMKDADDETNLEYAPHKSKLEQEMRQNELTMQEIDEFRDGLKSSISNRKRRIHPILELYREDAEDDIFERIPPKKKSKSNAEPAPEPKLPATPEKSETESVWESPPPKEHNWARPLGLNLPRSSSSSPAPSDDEDEDDFTDLFIPVSVPVSKKPKRISVDSARTDSTRMSSMSMSKSGEGLTLPLPPGPMTVPSHVANLINHGRGSGRGSKPGSVAGGSDHGISSMVNATKNKITQNKLDKVNVDQATSHVKRIQRAKRKDDTNSRNVSTCSSLPTQSGAMRATWEEIRAYLNLPEERQHHSDNTPATSITTAPSFSSEVPEDDKDNAIRNMRVCYTCPICGVNFPTTGDCVVHQQSTGHRSNPAITIFRR